MRIPRLHVDAPLAEAADLLLEGDAAHYIGKVLRLGPGHPVRLFNSGDGEFSAELVAVAKKSVQVRVGVAVACLANPTLPVHIGLGISRGERMDYAIQKATELGVTSLSPLFTERCEVRLGDDRADKRQQHWQRIAISACEQCGRTLVPAIDRPLLLDDWLSAAREGASFVLDHTGSNGLPADAQPSEIHLLIGPEGGLSSEEVEAAVQAGFQRARFGHRVLRTETAPVVALSMIQLLWGDFQA